MTAATVVGVDGCRGGWVVVTLRGRDVVAVAAAERFSAVLDAAVADGVAAIGVDMPIALAPDGDRPGDAEARRLLGPRASSLFPTPALAVLDATDYVDACARSRAATGRAISKQLWNLVPRIREVRAALNRLGDGAPTVREVHPETSFAVMGGEPFDTTKRSPAGLAGRIALLADHMTGLMEATASLRTGPGDARPGLDDVVDAAAAAWTAHRMVTGEALWLGEGADGAGRPYGLAV